MLVGVVVWVAWDYFADRGVDKREGARRNEKVETRRAILARMPDSAPAQEALGDALREAGQPEEAVACYRKALEIDAQVAQTAPGSFGAYSGTGLASKLRLTEQEAARGGQAAYGETLATRQQVCRQCGALNPPQERACTNCGFLLPVDGFFDTLRGDAMRGQIVREVAETAAMLLIVLLALWVFSALPLEVKGTLSISAMIVLTWRFLRRIGGN